MNRRFDMLTLGMRACRILRAHISGTIKLSPEDVQTYIQVVRNASAKSLYFFAKCVLGFDKMQPNPHRRWADDLQAKFWTEDRFGRLKPRGTYKTTLYGESFILWVWATVSPKIRILYTSANQALLDEVSAHLNHYIGAGSDSLYAFVFGITRDPSCKNTETAVNIIGRDQEAKGFSLTFRTAGGSTNGVHPNIIIVDDPCFAKGTPVLTSNGYKPIERIKVGELVLTKAGYKRVTWSGVTAIDAPVATYLLNGRILSATPNHGIITANRGKVAISELLKSDQIFELNEDGSWVERNVTLQILNGSTESHTGDTPTQRTDLIASTIGHLASLGRIKASIARFGRTITALSRKVSTCIIETVTTLTTIFQTSTLSMAAFTTPNIAENFKQTTLREPSFTWRESAKWPRNTTSLQNGSSDYKKLKTESPSSKSHVFNAGADSRRRSDRGTLPSIVRGLARAALSTTAKRLTSVVVASCAAPSSWSKSGQKQSVVRGRVVPSGPYRREAVYNITVEDEHQYIANGILVANCDKDDRESRAVREAKKRWFDTLTPLLVPIDVSIPQGNREPKTVTIKKTMLIATRWHLDDVIAYVQTKPGWHFEVEGVYDAHGNPSYPGLLPEDRIEEIRRQISEIFFACQYINSPLPEGSRIFSLDRLHYVRPEQFDTKLGTNIAFFDPSQGKDGSDYPAFILINVNERRIVFGAIDTKMDLTATIGVAAKLCLEHNVRTFVVETNGAMGIETTIANAMNAVGHTCVIEPIHETRNKVERISMCQPELYSGQVLFCTDHKDRYPTLMTQIEFFPAWSHDDFPDVVEKAVTWLGMNAPVSFSRGSGGGGRSTVSASKTLSGSIRRA